MLGKTVQTNLPVPLANVSVSVLELVGFLRVASEPEEPTSVRGKTTMPKAAAEPGSSLFKDRYNPKSIAVMGETIKREYPQFDVSAFVKSVITDEFPRLEFKDRGRAIARALAEHLPTAYGRAIDILIKAAPLLGGFENWAAITFIELFGIEHFEESVRGMKALTRYSSAESTVRPFMNCYLDRMMTVLHEWAEDTDDHVRRLAAEGSRPRGVWIAHIDAFKKDPSPVIALLEKLKADRSKYVRIAVANNLNDISKDHPDIAIKTALRWKQDGNKETDWIIRHACRSLIKAGDPRVFPIFGFTSNPRVTVEGLSAPRKATRIGEVVEFSFTIASKAKTRQKLAIDYRLHYVKASGKMLPKVFKLAEKTLGAGESLDLRIRQSFADVSVRKHFPGKHRLEIVINGKVIAEVLFEVRRL